METRQGCNITRKEKYSLAKIRQTRILAQGRLETVDAKGSVFAHFTLYFPPDTRNLG